MQKRYIPFLLAMAIMLTGLSSCSYHYAQKIKVYRKATLGTPSRSSDMIANGRSKTGYFSDMMHSFGVGATYCMNDFTLVVNDITANVKGTILMANLHYEFRYNFLPIGYKSSLSLNVPLHVGVPVLSDATGTSNSSVYITRVKDIGPMDISVFIPLTLNVNVGRNALAGVKGAGLGLGGGYMMAIAPGSDFAGGGPFTHGPYGAFDFRFGICTLGSYAMYSMRHEAFQLGGKFTFTF